MMVYGAQRWDGSWVSVQSTSANRIIFRLADGEGAVSLIVRFDDRDGPSAMLTGAGDLPAEMAEDLLRGYGEWGLAWLFDALAAVR